MKTETGAIVVPLDGSPFAQRALPWAIYLAQHLDRSVDLIQVVQPNGAADAIGRAHSYLSHVAATSQGENVTCSVQVRVGDPVHEIVHAARDSHARLITLACRGRAGIDRWILGSIADQLVQRAPVPVLVQNDVMLARHDVLPRSHGPILVPLDGSELAEMVLGETVAIARTLERGILLVRANELVEQIETGATPNPYVTNAIDEVSEGYLWGAVEWIRRQGIECKTMTGWASPGPFILEIARQQSAPLICMATRGRAGLGKFARGHVADAVVRDADVPVLLVGPLAIEGRRSPLAAPIALEQVR